MTVRKGLKTEDIAADSRGGKAGIDVRRWGRIESPDGLRCAESRMRSGVSGLAGQRKWTVIEQTNGYIGCHPAKRVSLGAVAIACGERDAGEGAICAGGRPLKGGVCEEGDQTRDPCSHNHVLVG